MSKPILDPKFWRSRLKTAPRESPHHAIYLCHNELWDRIEQKHREVLAATIKPRDSVFDAGCGWGRLLSLLPGDWDGDYLGVDLSPDFISIAQKRYPARKFIIGDLRRLSSVGPLRYDWAVLISVRPMVRGNLGDAVWIGMEDQIRSVANRILFLEYDPDDEGSVE